MNLPLLFVCPLNKVILELSEKGPVANLPYILIPGYSMFGGLVFSENVRRIAFTISAVALVLLFTAQAKTTSGLASERKEGSANCTFTCESHGFITGIVSDFNTVNEDRRYRGLIFFSMALSSINFPNG